MCFKKKQVSSIYLFLPLHSILTVIDFYSNIMSTEMNSTVKVRDVSSQEISVLSWHLQEMLHVLLNHGSTICNIYLS